MSSRIHRPPPTLLLLHPDPVFGEQIRRACERRYALQCVGGWRELREVLRSAPPTAMVVVDPYLGGAGRPAAALRSLREEFPSVTVIAALDLLPDRAADLQRLGEWGVAEVITLHEEDTPEAIARRLDSAQGRPLQSLLERSLPPGMSGQARALLLAAAEVVARGGQAHELARSLYLSPRTLLRWCERAALPPPRRLLVWMRILLACELLDDPGRTVLSVAYACGYASDNSLRRALHDLLRSTPTRLRRSGAFAVAASAFLRELETTQPARALSG